MRITQRASVEANMPYKKEMVPVMHAKDFKKYKMLKYVLFTILVISMVLIFVVLL